MGERLDSGDNSERIVYCHVYILIILSSRKPKTKPTMVVKRRSVKDMEQSGNETKMGYIGHVLETINNRAGGLWRLQSFMHCKKSLQEGNIYKILVLYSASSMGCESFVCIHKLIKQVHKTPELLKNINQRCGF